MKVHVERKEHVTTVILNRPEVRNAVDPETAEQLHQAIVEFEENEHARVAVLCGAGDTFCAGWDLKSLASGELPPHLPDEGALRVCRRIPTKPVIAAVNGYCVAGGLELALWCDLRVVAQDATFGVFCRRFGVPLIDGGTVRLPRLIGLSRALDLILTGRPVGAEEALSFGLANRVVPRGSERDEAEKLAAEIARFPQACLRADRWSAHVQYDFELAQAFRQEAAGGSRVVDGLLPSREIEQEARSGAARFASGAGRSGTFRD